MGLPYRGVQWLDMPSMAPMYIHLSANQMIENRIIREKVNAIGHAVVIPGLITYSHIQEHMILWFISLYEYPIDRLGLY